MPFPNSRECQKKSPAAEKLTGGGGKTACQKQRGRLRCRRGVASRKGGYPMRRFLRDVLATWLAAVLAAVAGHFMNL